MNMLELKLKTLHEASKVQQVEWDKVREEWREGVNALFDAVVSWLQKWVDLGYLKVDKSDIMLSEEHLGKYEIPKLKLIVGSEAIVLEPVGRHVLGARGRIDLYLIGFKSDARMVLWREDLDGTRRWEVWSDKSGRSRMPFNQETLERIMADWL